MQSRHLFRSILAGTYYRKKKTILGFNQQFRMNKCTCTWKMSLPQLFLIQFQIWTISIYHSSHVNTHALLFKQWLTLILNVIYFIILCLSQLFRNFFLDSRAVFYIEFNLWLKNKIQLYYKMHCIESKMSETILILINHLVNEFIFPVSTKKREKLILSFVHANPIFEVWSSKICCYIPCDGHKKQKK